MLSTASSSCLRKRGRSRGRHRRGSPGLPPSTSGRLCPNADRTRSATARSMIRVGGDHHRVLAGCLGEQPQIGLPRTEQVSGLDAAGQDHRVDRGDEPLSRRRIIGNSHERGDVRCGIAGRSSTTSITISAQRGVSGAGLSTDRVAGGRERRTLPRPESPPGSSTVGSRRARRTGRSPPAGCAARPIARIAVPTGEVDRLRDLGVGLHESSWTASCDHRRRSSSSRRLREPVGHSVEQLR